jgi:endo-1,4-beta-xylanase
MARAPILVLAVAAACSFCVPPMRAQTLRDDAARVGISLGTAVRPALLSERLCAATLAREFDLVEAEDAMKWWVVPPDQATFDFSQGDQVVAFAEVHRMKVRGHTLVWGWSNPAWLTSPSLTPVQLSQLLEEHVSRVVSHYRGKVFAWDVVNEAFDEHGHLKSSLWYDSPGIGLADKSSAYIEQAFRWAHAADPAALLFYNDSEGESINDKSDAIYAMVKDFKLRGTPIDGIGLQMHIFDLHLDLAGIDANIARFTALGIQVHITEMDIALPLDSYGNARESDLQRQAELHRRVASICMAHPGCSAIQTRGFTDKYSWIGWKTKGAKGSALLFDRKYVAKPAYEALRNAFNSKKQPPFSPSQH